MGQYNFNSEIHLLGSQNFKILLNSQQCEKISMAHGTLGKVDSFHLVNDFSANKAPPSLILIQIQDVFITQFIGLCFRYSVDDFVEGMYRTVPTSGTQYELVFHDRLANRSSHQYRTVTLLRPFAPLTVVTREHHSTKQLVRHFDTDSSYIELLFSAVLFFKLLCIQS